MTNKNENNNALEPLADSLIATTNLLATVTVNTLIFSVKAIVGIGSLIIDVANIGYKCATGTYEYEVATTDDAKCNGVNMLMSRSIKDVEPLPVNTIKYLPLSDLEAETIDNSLIRYEYVKASEGIKACVGYSVEGNKVWFDILNSHVLVGGASRWGKSSFLNVLITSLMLTYTENEVAFMGCDFKRSDVYYYKRFKHFRGTVATNKNEFMQHMSKLEEEMKKRSDILEENNCRNIIKFNNISDIKMSYIIYIIDELPLLTSYKDCTDKLRLIMGQCASYGIYFVLSTQDATKESIGKCKMNCSQTVGFHTKDETDSKTLIGSDILKDITVKGRCYIDSGSEITETQIFFLEEEEIEDLLKDKLKEKYKNGVCL